MKQFLLTLLVLSSLHACSPSDSEYKTVIKNNLEIDKDGKRTDLQIEFETFSISDITVQDSIDIINTNADKKRAERIQLSENSIKSYEKSIAKQKVKNTVVSRAIINDSKRLLANEKESLERIKIWQPEELNQYENRTPSEILAKKVTTSFSFFNPRLQSKQSYENAEFLLLKDGKICFGMLKK